MPAEGRHCPATSVRRRFAALVAALLATTASLALVALIGETEALDVYGQEGARPSSCSTVRRMIAAPSVVLLGDTTNITMTARLACDVSPAPLHIVLVLDGSLSGAPSRNMTDAAGRFVQRLDLSGHPQIQVGIVYFNSLATTVCELTNQTSRILGCIDRAPEAGGTRIDLGIEQGLRVLRRGRGRVTDRDALREVMILVSGTPNNAGCPPVQNAAVLVKSDGVLLIAVCMGPLCDVACIRGVSSGPQSFFEGTDAASMLAIFEQIRRNLILISAHSMTITSILPANLTYVGSAGEPPIWDEPSRRLEWNTSPVSGLGVTHTFTVRPEETGLLPASAGAEGTFSDTVRAAGHFTFTVPLVMVVSPGSVPTPGSRPTPTAVPTPRPLAVYLPRLLSH